MKKFKFIVFIMLLVFSASVTLGCEKNNEVKEETKPIVEESHSIAKVLSKQFKEEIKNEMDIKKVANNLSNNAVLKNISMDVITIEKGDYISGFQTEIRDFNKAVGIRPIIGTIPFVAYIFEVEDASAFSENLKSNADLRWNICTEAEEMETAIVDDYVFFVMAPENFEEE